MQSSAGARRGGALARSRFDAGGPEVGAAGGEDGFGTELFEISVFPSRGQARGLVGNARVAARRKTFISDGFGTELFEIKVFCPGGKPQALVGTAGVAAGRKT